MTNIYQEEGYIDRDDYIESLAMDFGLNKDIVWALADVLGPNEDFDGLVTELEDMEGDFENEWDW